MTAPSCAAQLRCSARAWHVTRVMDERRYFELVSTVFREIEDRLDDVDADDVDVERAGDVITLTFREGRKCILNTQRPSRQIWLAANARAWHFDFDEATGTWVDDKGQGIELVSQVAEIVRESAGITV